MLTRSHFVRFTHFDFRESGVGSRESGVGSRESVSIQRSAVSGQPLALWHRLRRCDFTLTCFLQKFRSLPIAHKLIADTRHADS
ncbi:hypothetical protein [Moorena sp. SIO3B2]|uniref:hypothetical protein n=1 Tax=Moorena sp. SIO3B2 TaxID=2607827 RepID=UPI0013C9053E|nr:hypothetical protein [Moorena sp. SIO3B2]NEP36997.1 hypothetical protein [Moorena sp. SIO3B2]